MNEQSLNLKDIHLPDPISWWPPAPGWWLSLALVLLLIITVIIARKIYTSRQLKRDIIAELDAIKQAFTETSNKSQLAKSLSVLLRRASISYRQQVDIAGLTGERWLAWLDNEHCNPDKQLQFQSETGKILLNAPYLPEHAELDFDAEALIQLCESWLLAKHQKDAGEDK